MVFSIFLATYVANTNEDRSEWAFQVSLLSAIALFNGVLRGPFYPWQLKALAQLCMPTILRYIFLTRGLMTYTLTSFLDLVLLTQSLAVVALRWVYTDHQVSDVVLNYFAALLLIGFTVRVTVRITTRTVETKTKRMIGKWRSNVLMQLQPFLDDTQGQDADGQGHTNQESSMARHRTNALQQVVAALTQQETNQPLQRNRMLAYEHHILPEVRGNEVIEHKDDSEDDRCVICQDNLTPGCPHGPAVVQLPCGHQFHRDCIQPWFIRSFECP